MVDLNLAMEIANGNTIGMAIKAVARIMENLTMQGGKTGGNGGKNRGRRASFNPHKFCVTHQAQGHDEFECRKAAREKDGNNGDNNGNGKGNGNDNSGCRNLLNLLSLP